MTFGDLFAGRWTWLQLAGEFGPMVVLTAMAFFAGHARGWNSGFHYCFNLTMGLDDQAVASASAAPLPESDRVDGRVETQEIDS